MHCSHLSLVNFRNYARLELDLPPGVSVFVGENAQGKSNLLEALYILATTKSFRAGADRELINWRVLGTDLAYARLTARVDRHAGPVRLEALLREEPRREEPRREESRAQGGNGTPNGSQTVVAKRLKLNDVPRRAIDVIGAVNVVMFSPQDIELVDGPPMLRRRYLDITISQVDHRYVRTLADYNRVLLQRNSLLRQIKEHRARPDQLFPWDHEMVTAGAYVIQQREATIARLADLAQEYHRQLTGRQEVLQIDYRPTFPLPGARPTAEAIAESFKAQLRAVQPREVAAGISMLGPHRDDLAFVVDDHPMGSFGSRGQQRTVALALKLAEAEFLRAQTGDPPMLLLDDVLSELDAARRRHVLGTVAPGQQVVLTGTDLASFEPEFLAEAKVYNVKAGTIEPHGELQGRGELQESSGVTPGEPRAAGEARLPQHGR